ncbi:hypothetical protein H5410_046397 [Solanum commersonii]|uniref:Uncharacterized protein n=1 Tax=Solanum commersonii TaxID=4109 RepID=A0A9J5XC55_SOLCO|nr:hypothetical protein H5410_046397 [Solanum commersonii]
MKNMEVGTVIIKVGNGLKTSFFGMMIRLGVNRVIEFFKHLENFRGTIWQEDRLVWERNSRGFFCEICL